jgi:hypothetical protein
MILTITTTYQPATELGYLLAKHPGKCQSFELSEAEPMEIAVPKLSLVVLIGPSGSGKSTFARKHFLSTEVLSSDECRALVAEAGTQHGPRRRGPVRPGQPRHEAHTQARLAAKRSLAIRDFALGVEALERFARKEPLAAPMSASLACWRWKASRSTHGCRNRDGVA